MMVVLLLSGKVKVQQILVVSLVKFTKVVAPHLEMNSALIPIPVAIKVLLLSPVLMMVALLLRGRVKAQQILVVFLVKFTKVMAQNLVMSLWLILL